MIPTGSRLLLGATTLAALAAVAYAISNGGSLGTTGLIFAACALALIAGVNLFTRDANVSAMDPTAATESAAARPAPPASIWPIIGALGGVLVVIGLVTYPIIFVFGIVALLAATFEWMMEAWSERASADPRYNAGIRARLGHPIEFPVLALLLAAVVIYSFSRIMLYLSKTGGPAVFGVVAALILAAGFIIAFRPRLGPGTISAVASVAVLALVAGGVAAALAGEREMHHIPTANDLASEGSCEVAEETEADDKASQSVRDTANVHGEVILRGDGTLVAKTEGFPEGNRLNIVKANVTNVLFRNDSDEDRRLVLTLGSEPIVDEETGEETGESVPIQICSALVETGGRQLLTFTIPRSSAVAESPYTFTVPGVDGQVIEVEVL